MDLLKTLCEEYLAKLEQGKLEPAEQLMAATIFRESLKHVALPLVAESEG